MSGWYFIQNDELVAMVREHYDIKGDLFWAKLDRKARTMTDEATGEVWDIPLDFSVE